MSESQTSKPTLVGAYESKHRPGLSVAEAVAVLASLAWALGAAVYFLFLYDADAGDGERLRSLQLVLTVFAVLMPVAMIWVAAMAARSARVMREESLRLRTAIDAIRQAYVSQNQKGGDASIARKLDEIAMAQRKTETALLTFSSIRDHSAPADAAPQPALATPAPRPQDADQAPLPLGTPEEAPQVPVVKDDFVRALNFPETAEDEEGFAALRKALRDRQTALLIQAAQDVLTLLSQDGIYMDDLRPDTARSEIWRRFAAGERGRQIAALGGIRDRSSLALAAGRMKQDPIFRDAAHHFLRRFDKMFVEFEKTGSDQDIQDLADTRTARAFMLLGRVAGIFD
ncbi:hypothetical protein [Pseudooceanicola marinus]|uniref:hypothetical protein n=1 Tax=Pseudooceanicola marinus TaxID=396013 RepID=UPI001CD2F097|nr:hypothetical protein [Pseudooceanicola marinus]MCA1336274.1 hypothetical protein [Pseudooceanicola marinus]